MYRNYLKIALRNIRKYKLHSFINIIGLAVAFSVSILLFLVAYFHFSFDSFHKDSDQLFKVSRFTNASQGMNISSNMPLPLGPVLKEEIPEIEAAITFHSGMPATMQFEDIGIEKIISRTDAYFFDNFNFPILIGDKKTALAGIYNIALSESTAKAIFGAKNPIGEELRIGKTGEQKTYTVSAIIADAPKNSSIRFDAVARIESLPDFNVNKNNWEINFPNLYVKISKNSNQKVVADKLVSMVEKYYPEQLAQLKTEQPEATETNELLSLNLTPMDQVHFSGERSAPKTLIYAIAALGSFILLIACFNFVNLNMAHSFKRSRELGVRKTLGAFKGQLLLQLWGEAFILYAIGFVLGLVLAIQLVPVFNAQFGGGIQIEGLFQPTFIAIIFGVFLLVTMIAGGYPALKMANFGLVDILKGNVSKNKPGTLRNSLLVSQFAISSLLIFVSVIAGQQLNFLKDKPIGFEKEQVISIPIGSQEEGRKVLSRLQNELASDPEFVSISGAGGNLGRGRDRITSRENIDFIYKENRIDTDWVLVDFNYLKTLQIPLLKGRDFSADFATDTIDAVVVTESFVKAMGETDPIGKYFGGKDEQSGNRIIGVVADFYAHSPSDRSLPIVMHLSSTEAFNYIFLKIQSDSPSATMNKLSTVWEEITADVDFKASFLDENLQAWYEGESILTTTFGFASGVAIFLSCLGLFAISLMVIEIRTKEIGIRKVMGASVKEIVKMISFHFMKLIFISLLIATPLAWYAMQSWIEGYEHRIVISPDTFIGVGIMVTLIALLTVSFHVIKAAIINPVNSLRSE
ncbi:FtsX-like permease family protein [uncultured Cyclobacterium sp.]|uniref:ABC transporter permease n=1 Tax=uncultured Cyclobacterium sp. TaxID=453820 RepID=UPI0030EE05AB|tara:strand:+ start:65877 stop:68288 length:2412 start_codon:yes stop_codon:yes gene_type:complete